MNFRKSFFAVLVVSTLSGCALTTDRIDIQYHDSGGALVSGARSVTVAVHVVDQRQDRTKVGSKKNGYGMEMAPIVANEDVTITIEKAIDRELEVRGFRIQGRPTVQLNAEITRFSNEFKMGFVAGDAVAEMILSVSVKSSAGAQTYGRQIVAQGAEPNIQLATGDNAKLALEHALANGIQTLFSDQAFVAALVGSSRS